jgi:Raf kinase inhibitor-like YbhB/YbcL family protein
MKLTSTSFADNQRIPGDFAFCVANPDSHACLGSNRNPHLAWTDVPPGARSLVLLCHDPDVPSVGDDVNKEGRIVPASLPRVDFFHWVLVDLALEPMHIVAGEFSSAVTPRGKAGPVGPRGTRQGINDYTNWFAGDADMGGAYFGYDGPCPPWNDAIRHRYVFTLFALDAARCPVEGRFTGQDVRSAMAGHVLGQASLTGLYNLNPAVTV